MSRLKRAREAVKQAKKERLGMKGVNQRPVTTNQKIPAFYLDDNDRKIVSHEEIAGRCMHSADMMLKQTNRAFLKFYAEPEAIPLCYMLFAYHQNGMITGDLTSADVVVEIYEQEEAPHIMGTKDDVVYLALFKEDEGVMPWLAGDRGEISDKDNLFSEFMQLSNGKDSYGNINLQNKRMVKIAQMIPDIFNPFPENIRVGDDVQLLGASY